MSLCFRYMSVLIRTSYTPIGHVECTYTGKHASIHGGTAAGGTFGGIRNYFNSPTACTSSSFRDREGGVSPLAWRERRCVHNPLGRSRRMPLHEW